MWRPPNTGRLVATGTTGVCYTIEDKIRWQERVKLENTVNTKITSKFSMRDAIKGTAFPKAPHEVVPRSGKGLVEGFESNESGWDSDSETAKEFRKCLNEKTAAPRVRFPYAATSQQSFGWSLSHTVPLSRSSSIPAHLVEASNSTNYEWLRPALQERMKARSRRWEAKLADAEDGLVKAMAESAKYFGQDKRTTQWCARPGKTDATLYESQYITFTGGVPLHKTNPKSDKVILTDKRGALVNPWK